MRRVKTPSSGRFGSQAWIQWSRSNPPDETTHPFGTCIVKLPFGSRNATSEASARPARLGAGAAAPARPPFAPVISASLCRCHSRASAALVLSPPPHTAIVTSDDATATAASARTATAVFPSLFIIVSSESAVILPTSGA